MTQHLNPFSGRQFLDANGDPYSGAQLFIYEAGSSTKYTTTKDQDGLSNHANPIVLNSRGEPADGAGAAQAIWQSDGDAVKLVLAPSDDEDPPVSAIASWDNIEGINDAVSTTASQWISGPTPTYVDATNFTLVGDQTTDFHVGRRLKFSVTAGTVYGYITVSAYTTLTTVTVTLDSGSLDAGLSAVWYGMLTETGHSIPFGAYYTALGQILYGGSDGNAVRLGMSSIGRVLGVNSTKTALAWVTRRDNHGMVISNNASDATNDIDISVGGRWDTTGGIYIYNSSVFTKQINAAWAAGSAAGGFPTGITLTNDTWYKIFAIIDQSAGTIDFGFDTSGTATNLLADATDYDAYALIGYVYYGTATIDGFQSREISGGGIEYLWDNPPLDADATQTNTASQDLYTLSVPAEEVTAIVNFWHTGSGENVYLKCPDTDDEAASTTAAPLQTGDASTRSHGNFYVRTDSSGRVGVRTDYNGTTVRIATLGFIQERV